MDEIPDEYYDEGWLTMDEVERLEFDCRWRGHTVSDTLGKPIRHTASSYALKEG